jgi:hypothetical protein
MPEPWQILGLRLRPFTLEHYKILRRFNNAFTSDSDASATPADLFFGVLVCSMKPSDFMEFFQSKTFVKEVDAWKRKVGRFNFIERAKMFKSYIDEHSITPKYWIEQESDSKSGGHWCHGLEVTLRSKLHWNTQDLETFPLSKALADYFQLAENEGSIRLMTRDEIELIETQNGK